MKKTIVLLSLMVVLLNGCGLGSLDVVTKNTKDRGSYYERITGVDNDRLRQLVISAIDEVYREKGKARPKGTFFFNYYVEILGENSSTDKSSQLKLRINSCIEDHLSNFFGDTIRSCSKMDFVGSAEFDETKFKSSTNENEESSVSSTYYESADKDFKEKLQEVIKQKLMKDIQ